MKMKHWLYTLVFGWLACRAVEAQNWQPTSLPNANYTGAAMSADGTKQIILGFGGWKYYLSTNSGQNWSTNTEPQINVSGEWINVASSADGSTLIAGGYSTNFWVSTNSGISW